MKTRTTILLCILVSLLLGNCSAGKKYTQAPGSSNAVSIRVLCYNIHHANPPSRPDVIDIEGIARVIRSEKPDLVALQEIDVYTTRSGKGLHQSEELGRLTGMKSYFAKAIDYGGGEYGIAILSKYPFDTTENRSLPTAAGTGGEPRTLATVTVNLPNGRKLLFACTHLDAQKGDTNRILQANKIVETLAKESTPIILAGDFNDVPSSTTINILDRYFTRTCKNDCTFTIPVINPSKTIDFIFYAPAGRFRVIEHRTIPETYASDHRPVMAVLRFE